MPDAPGPSRRPAAAMVQFFLAAPAWVVVHLLLDRLPWREAPTPLGQLVLSGLAFGVFMGLVEWWLWPRRQRRRSNPQAD